MEFSRTKYGLIAQYNFYSLPVIWVEGIDDVVFFSQILDASSCIVKPAHGRSNCVVLEDALIKNNYPFVVIRDGDYEILQRKRSKHRRSILLRRYSIENYFLDKDVFKLVCEGLCKEDLAGDDIEKWYKDVINEFEIRVRELLESDIANILNDTGTRCLPRTSNIIIDFGKEITYKDNQIRELLNECSPYVNKKDIENASDLLSDFLKTSNIINIVRGHLVFNLVRNLILQFLKKKDKKMVIDNEGLLYLLSIQTWNLKPDPDHKKLRRKLQSALRETRQLITE